MREMADTTKIPGTADQGEALRALYLEAIRTWIAAHPRQREAFTAGESGELDGTSRVLALRNSIIANVIDYCRRDGDADSTLAC
jgi:hypothetical protein